MKIESRANRHKVTRWMYEAIFTERRRVVNDSIFYVKGNKKINPYSIYKGRIIRNINIVPLDPFGYSVNDTSFRKPGRFERIGNNFHVSTQKNVIRNLLLFKKNKPLDPLEISESERLLRLSPYVNDAHIYARKVGRDSVDLLVVEQDKWTTIGSAGIAGNRYSLNLVERNIFGTGHQLEESLLWDQSARHLGTAGKYSVFNIRRTFISAAVFYGDIDETKRLGVSLDRPFYSPLAKWAGGVLLTRNYGVFRQQLGQDITLIKTYDLDYNIQDIWAAKSYHLTESKQALISERSKSYITGARYYHLDHFSRPGFETDTNKLNRDETMYLFNVGFTQRKYYRDRYLYRFGANEDIPQGYLAEIIGGTSKREFTDLRYYTGVKLSAGSHFEKLGYISGGVSYGTFYNKGFTGGGVVNVDAFYFTDLMQRGSWYFRGFTRFKMAHGLNRDAWDQTNINGAQMYGFTSPTLTANSKMLLNFEFVLYAPFEIVGFRLAPVLLCGLATLGNGVNDLINKNIYQSYALGLLIRNEHLVINTFEISIGLYPFIPGQGDYIMRFNPISNYQVRAADFITARPDLVSY